MFGGVLSLSMVHNSGTNLQKLKVTYNTTTITQDIYTNAATRWMNIQIQAKPNEIMNVYAYDIETFVLEPAGIFQFTNLGVFTDGNMTLIKPAASLGVYIGETKVFAYDSTSSMGIYYRYYNLIAIIPTEMVEYFRVTNGDVVINGHNGTVSSIPWGNTIELPFTFCNTSEKLSAISGTCVECVTSGCQYCQQVDISYNDLCRKCDTTYYSWSVSSICPIDFYMKKGICLDWPIGCSECTDENTCTSWDASLVLTTLGNGTISCKCGVGLYGTDNLSTDTIDCNACTAPCTDCDVAATTCTACTGSDYLLISTCTTNWGTGKYGEVSNNTCQDWGSNWDVCTDNTTCTTCSGGFLLYSGTCVGSCPTNSILNGANWDICDTGCSTCAPNVSTCTQCSSGYFLATSGNTCGATCLTTEFGNDVSDPVNPIWEAWNVACTEWSSDTICTKCPNTEYLNSAGAWVATCAIGTFQDQHDANDKFCRRCPSTCTTCTSITECVLCQSNFYKLTLSGTDIRCVQTCPEGMYDDASGSPWVCTSCKTDCEFCTSATDCQQCTIGKVSQFDGASDQWQASWDTGYYILDGVCTVCGSNWDTCDDNEICTTCTTGYSLNDTYCVLDASCTGNYYIDTAACIQCPVEWAMCTNAATWTQCENGYSLTSGACNSNCGNNQRDEFETWDDGNSLDGDGWDDTCQVEPYYFCEAVPPPNPDIWYCDSYLVSAKWLDHFKSIEIVFGTEVIVNTTSLGAVSSTNSIALCLEIIDASLHSQLGALTTCSKMIDPITSYTYFEIDFSADATLGSTLPTQLILNHLQTTNGWPIPIQTTYDILSLPVDQPVLVFSETSTDVSLWAEEYFLDILSSKGMTYRTSQSITWNILSVGSITTSAEKVALDTLVNTNFANLNYMKLNYTTIANYIGKKIELRVAYTNFMGNSATKDLIVSMLSKF
jgi:hypothetical protein